MVYRKISKGLPPLKRSKLGKKAQDKQDEFKKKLYEANKWWNNRKSQLHWNKLEWVNPKSLTKRNKPFSVSSIFYLNKNDRTSHWFGHSSFRELDTIDFKKENR